MGWDDDVYLGEALRGMQDGSGSLVGGNTEIGAVARGLNQLRGQLAQLAGTRFNRHAPLQKTLRSPYKDSTQLGIECTGIVNPASYGAGLPLPTITGLTRSYQSFKPEKAIASELLIVTFSNDSEGETTRAASVPDCGDIVLVQAFAGNYNCFPNAPNQNNGIAGIAFANDSYGNAISWPTINPGIDVSVGFAIERTALYRVSPPTGYTTDDITQIEVKIRFNVFGPQLR